MGSIFILHLGRYDELPLLEAISSGYSRAVPTLIIMSEEELVIFYCILLVLKARNSLPVVMRCSESVIQGERCLFAR